MGSIRFFRNTRARTCIAKFVLMPVSFQEWAISAPYPSFRTIQCKLEFGTRYHCFNKQRPNSCPIFFRIKIIFISDLMNTILYLSNQEELKAPLRASHERHSGKKKWDQKWYLCNTYLGTLRAYLGLSLLLKCILQT